MIFNLSAIKDYINLIKPGIVIGNFMSSVGGFLMASQGCIHYSILIYMSVGLSFVIAASCVFNNIIDRDIDSIMDRTKNRTLAQKKNFSIKKSTFFAITLNIIGLLFLSYTKSLLAILLTITGVLVYVVLYSLYMKRNSIYSMIIGSISGALPPVIGYCTVTNKLDVGAVILLLIFIFWQIPHSYSILIFRFHDYQNALVPTFVIQKGIPLTRVHMIICIIGFFLTTASLTILGYTSILFLIAISIINVFWLYTGLYEYRSMQNHLLWSRKMFFISIIIITLLNLLLSIDTFLNNISKS